MKYITMGIIGHVDHGKTALVKALTGIDTDRLKEEKERGISIVLGYSHLTLPQGEIGIIDVPGHEKFIRTMIAGATAIMGVSPAPTDGKSVRSSVTISSVGTFLNRGTPYCAIRPFSSFPFSKRISSVNAPPRP